LIEFITASRATFPLNFRTIRIADPRFVEDPRNNDFYTKPGSPARDAALREPLLVDPRNSTYCHLGPDIGFLESCT
jgi:hypothetical protein